MRVLVTGATGFIGSRLVPRLLDDGHEVVALTRARERAEARPWGHRVTIAEGDVADAKSVTGALMGCDAAAYLVHGMTSGADFEATEAAAARTFADAASLAGIGHVVYLGGLADDADRELSPHLRSRVETGRLLADGGPPTTELRASIVLGSGSSSFELIRFAAGAAPLVPRPNWAKRRCQPVAVADLLDVLVEALVGGAPAAQHRIVDVGGPEALEYVELVHRYRAVAGRSVLPTIDVYGLPVAVAAVASTVMTPIPATLVAPLVESLAHDTVVGGTHDRAVGPTSLDDALRAGIEGTGDAATMVGDPGWVDHDTTLPSVVAWWLTRPAAGILQGPQLVGVATRIAREALVSVTRA